MPYQSSSRGFERARKLGHVPTADNADLNLYTGTDVTNLGPSQQGGSQTRSNNTISRHVNLANPQFVFFSLANNGSQVVAYSGAVSPFFERSACRAGQR